MHTTDVVIPIHEPTIPDLVDHLRTVDFELNTRIFKFLNEIYKPLQLFCEEYIGSLISDDPLLSTVTA